MRGFVVSWIGFLLISGFSSAQISFPQQNAYWGIADFDEYGIYQGFTPYRNLRDTLITGTTWHILLDEQNRIEAFREDSIQRIFALRILNSIPQPEILTYDFSLQAGDTFIYNYPGGILRDTLVLDSVSHDFPYSGFTTSKPVWQFHLVRQSQGSMLTCWIDGVGTASHVLFPRYQDPLTGFNRTTCFTDSGMIRYELYPSFCLITEKGNEKEIPGIEVTPNPFSDSFTIFTQLKTPYSIRLYDMNGKAMLRQERISGEYELNAAEWNPGIYLLEIEMNGLGEFRRLIKAN